MMIKIAVVLCAVMATSMVIAIDVEEQELANLMHLLISEEVSSPEDAVALQGLFSNVAKSVGNAVHKVSGVASDLCRNFGYSPEVARAEVLKAFPGMKEEEITKEDLGKYCTAAHGIHNLGR